MLKTGVTRHTNTTISDLIPCTDYKIRVCVQLLSGRINLDKCLEINVSTTASGKIIFEVSLLLIYVFVFYNFYTRFIDCKTIYFILK